MGTVYIQKPANLILCPFVLTLLYSLTWPFPQPKGFLQLAALYQKLGFKGNYLKVDLLFQLKIWELSQTALNVSHKLQLNVSQM